jgi:hypothetical protein
MSVEKKIYWHFDYLWNSLNMNVNSEIIYKVPNKYKILSVVKVLVITNIAEAKVDVGFSFLLSVFTLFQSSLGTIFLFFCFNEIFCLFF